MSLDFGCGISTWDLGFGTLDDRFMSGVSDLILGIWDLGLVIYGFGIVSHHSSLGDE